MRIPAFARLRPVMVTVLLAAALVSGVVAQTEQTPIDIDHRDVTRATLPALQFNYPDSLTLQVVNTGSPDEFATVRAIPPSQAASLTVDGVQYNLLQFHWHTSSEHEVNGLKYPLEMHFVHQSAGGTLLVVGVFIKPGTSQRELKKIFSHLPQDAEDTKTVESFNLNKILPKKKTSFRYAGSLTTPPFTEGVKWVVLDTPISLPPKQIQAFQELFPEGNSREVQPLDGRSIFTDVTRPGFYHGGR